MTKENIIQAILKQDKELLKQYYAELSAQGKSIDVDVLNCFKHNLKDNCMYLLMKKFETLQIKQSEQIRKVSTKAKKQ